MFGVVFTINSHSCKRVLTANTNVVHTILGFGMMNEHGNCSYTACYLVYRSF